MRLETTTIISEKSPCAFSNLKQTTVINILNVVIMMRMTYASFMKMLIRALCEALVIVAETKGVPRQRIRK